MTAATTTIAHTGLIPTPPLIELLAPPAPLVTSDIVVERLQEGVTTFIALARSGTRLGDLADEWPKWVIDALLAYAKSSPLRKTPRPAHDALLRMREAIAWLGLLPLLSHRDQRLIMLRSVANPRTGNPANSWARIGRMFGCHRETVRNWHAAGIAVLVEAINEEPTVHKQVVDIN